MGIDFSKFSKDIQSKIKAALSDSKISAEELRAMNLDKETAIKLMQELSGNPDFVGDGFVHIKIDNKSLLSLDKLENDTIVPLTKQALEHYNQFYPNKDIQNGYYKDGKMYFLNSQGKMVRDIFNNYLSENITVEPAKKDSPDFIDPDGKINVQKLQEHLNTLPDTDKDYQEVMSDINEATKEHSYWSIETFADTQKERFIEVYQAINNGDFSLAIELMYSYFSTECQGFDENILSKIRSGLERLTGAKWAGPALYNALSYVAEHADNLGGRDENGIGYAERFVVGLSNADKGLGDFVFSTEGLATMGAIATGEALLAKASSKLAPYIGTAIHSYFGADGSMMVADGATRVATGKTLEEVEEGGQEIGHGLPMIPTVIRAGVVGYKGTKSFFSGLKINEFRTKLRETTSFEELKTLEASIDEMAYSRQEKLILKMECTKQYRIIDNYKKINENLQSETKPQEETTTSDKKPYIKPEMKILSKEHKEDLLASDVSQAEETIINVPKTPQEADEFLAQIGFSQEEIAILTKEGEKNVAAISLKLTKELAKEEEFEAYYKQIKEGLTEDCKQKEEEFTEYAMQEFDNVHKLTKELFPNSGPIDTYNFAFCLLVGTKEEVIKKIEFVKSNKKIFKGIKELNHRIIDSVEDFALKESNLSPEVRAAQMKIIFRLNNKCINAANIDVFKNPKSVEEMENCAKFIEDFYDELTQYKVFQKEEYNEASYIAEADCFESIKLRKQLFDEIKNDIDCFERPESFLEIINCEHTTVLHNGDEFTYKNKHPEISAQAKLGIKLYKEVGLKEPLTKYCIEYFYKKLPEINEYQIKFLKDIFKEDSSNFAGEAYDMTEHYLPNINSDIQVEFAKEIYYFTKKNDISGLKYTLFDMNKNIENREQIDFTLKLLNKMIEEELISPNSYSYDLESFIKMATNKDFYKFFNELMEKYSMEEIIVMTRDYHTITKLKAYIAFRGTVIEDFMQPFPSEEQCKFLLMLKEEGFLEYPEYNAKKPSATDLPVQNKKVNKLKEIAKRIYYKPQVEVYMKLIREKGLDEFTELYDDGWFLKEFNADNYQNMLDHKLLERFPGKPAKYCHLSYYKSPELLEAVINFAEEYDISYNSLRRVIPHEKEEISFAVLDLCKRIKKLQNNRGDIPAVYNYSNGKDEFDDIFSNKKTLEDIQAKSRVMDILEQQKGYLSDYTVNILSHTDTKTEAFITELISNKTTDEISSSATLISTLDDTNVELVKYMYYKGDFDISKISEISAQINQNNIKIAEKLIKDETNKYEPGVIKDILKETTNISIDFVEEILEYKEIEPKNVAAVANFLNRYQRDGKELIEPALESSRMREWLNKNLNNRISIDNVVHLAKTQQKLYKEADLKDEAKALESKKEAARQAQVEAAAAEVRVDVNALEQITKSLVDIGVPEGMAKNAYAKLCADSNGNVDAVKLDAVKALIKAFGIERVEKKGKLRISVNISPKDIADIFKLATGDKISLQNGVFRPNVIKDIIALKECGTDDIKFAMNLAAIKNMDLVEMKARFKGETRQDIAKRIDGIEINIKTALESRGINLDAIKEKALTSDKKIAEAEILREPAQEIHIRSLDEITGTERIVLNKFKDKIQPEQWQSKEAFARWAEEKLADMTDWEKHPEYSAKGKFDKYNDARKNSFEEWIKYLQSDESGIKDDIFAQIVFLDGMVKEMKPDNAYTPPAISREGFEAVYNALLENDTTVNTSKIYAKANRTKAILQYGKATTSKDGIEGIWVKIPQGGKRGEPAYDEHIAMIQALSEGSSWCLRFENAHNYLAKGDLHFFMMKTPDGDYIAQTAINVKTDGEIIEIERRYQQNGTVPVPYAEVIQEWKKANGFTGLKYKIEKALKAKPEFDKQKAKIEELIKNGDTKGIVEELGINCAYLHDGTFVIDNYCGMAKGEAYSLCDLGIDENKLMQNVSIVSNVLDLEGSMLTSAPKLKEVGERIYFGEGKVSDLRNLEKINGLYVYWDKK